MYYEARVVLPYTTGLPTDVSTNTFSFWEAEPVADPVVSALLIADALVDFYNGNGSNGPAYYISPIVSRATDACRVEVYDRQAPTPRAPLATLPFTLGGNTTGALYPADVALCLSFQGGRQSGVPQSRRRGRIYLGPLTVAVATTSTTLPPVPASSAITNILARAVALSSNVRSDSIIWQVWSTVDQAGVDLVEAWIDNVFDTQRRRDVAPSTRSTATLV